VKGLSDAQLAAWVWPWYTYGALACGLPLALLAESWGYYSDQKVANREIRVWHFRDRQWLLNDGHIQNPSAQS
jgi:hypothetical protein